MYKDRYQLYYKYSDYTHWNNLSGYIAYKKLMEYFNIYIDNLDDINIYEITNKYRHNYLYNKYESDYYTDFRLNYEILNLDIYHSNYSIKNYLYSVDPNLQNNVVRTKSISNILSDNALVIRDSYGVAIFDYIASSFYKSSFIYIDNFKNNEIIYNNSNIVIFETVERGLKDRLLNVLPSYRIEEINRDLKTNSEAVNN